MPFYTAGALAGLAMSIAYSALKIWRRSQHLRGYVRGALVVLFGTLIVWLELGGENISMALSERATMSLLWFCAGGALLFGVDRLTA